MVSYLLSEKAKALSSPNCSCPHSPPPSLPFSLAPARVSEQDMGSSDDGWRGSGLWGSYASEGGPARVSLPGYLGWVLGLYLLQQLRGDPKKFFLFPPEDLKFYEGSVLTPDLRII